MGFMWATGFRVVGPRVSGVRVRSFRISGLVKQNMHENRDSMNSMNFTMGPLSFSNKGCRFWEFP